MTYISYKAQITCLMNDADNTRFGGFEEGKISRARAVQRLPGAGWEWAGEWGIIYVGFRCG